MKTHFSLAAAIVLAATAAAAEPRKPSGLGCNGVVNPAIEGCGPLDNNRGPKFPYFKAELVTIPTGQARIERRDGALMAQHQGKWLPVVSAENGAVTVAADPR